MRALKFDLVENNIKIDHRMQISLNLVPGQLSNLWVKLEQNRLFFRPKLKLNGFFFQKITNFMHYFSYEIITYCQNDPQKVYIDLRSYLFWPVNWSSIYTVTENVNLCSSVPPHLARLPDVALIRVKAV